MEKKQGTVLKKKNRSCIVMTSEGEFCKIPLPKHPVQVGEEISFTPTRFYAIPRSFLVAASILLLFLAGIAYRGLTPSAAAYVSLDINPSLEFAVDAKQKITAVRGLNTAGEELLAKVKPVRLGIYEGIELVIEEAVNNHYLDRSKENVVLSTITVAPEAKQIVEQRNVYAAINKPLQTAGIQNEVLVQPVDKATRIKAQKAGMSSGRYLLYVQAHKKGVPISVEELNQSNIGKLQKDKQIKLRELVSHQSNEQRQMHTVQDKQNTKKGMSGKPDGNDPKEKKTNKSQAGIANPDISNESKTGASIKLKNNNKKNDQREQKQKQEPKEEKGKVEKGAKDKKVNDVQ